jgi:hypothetical protein
LTRGVLATLRHCQERCAHRQKNSIKMEAQRVDIGNRTGNRYFDLLGRRPEAGLVGLLTDKRRIPLRSASVRTYAFFTTGFPRFF